VLTCSADGLTSTTVSDCATSGKACVAATCMAVVCSPGSKFCQGQELRQCGAGGDSSTVVQACAATQYCDLVSLSCKAQVCTPNQPACAGTVRTTCNADGSGVLGGGTDCSPMYCVAGVCADSILREDFEDGNYDGWVEGSSSSIYTRTVTSMPGPMGTPSNVLCLTKMGPSVTPDGLSYTFAGPVQPRSISYWVEVTLPQSTMGDTRFVNGTDVLFQSYFGYYIELLYSSPYMVAASSNTWYHVELRNIDWTARTFDLYLNDAVVVAAAKLAGTSTSITSIQLYNAYYLMPYYTACWDDIVLLP